MRGLTRARDEFQLAATVQNLKTIANDPFRKWSVHRRGQDNVGCWEAVGIRGAVPDCVRGKVKADTALFFDGEQFQTVAALATDDILLAIRMNSAPAEVAITTSGLISPVSCHQDGDYRVGV